MTFCDKCGLLFVPANNWVRCGERYYHDNDKCIPKRYREERRREREEAREDKPDPRQTKLFG